ncbi:MAG: hypothetical protein ACOCVA_00925 [Prolixibacteraceae bacterium]
MEKPRHVRKIKDLPISELTDEEIVKAAMHRLESDCTMLVYTDVEFNRIHFMARWKNKAGRETFKRLKKAWEQFGKIKTIKE